MNKVDQRKSRRATVNLLVGETTGGKYFVPLLADISADGLMIESPSGLERPRAHDSVIELSLPGCKEIIRARCRIVRRKVKGFFEKQALKFVDISAVDRKHIKLYVQRCVGLA
jgi:c-di-GMP-binding flagellar brake protein YcgR